MSRLECQKCKVVYQDVNRVNKCPHCGQSDFLNADIWKMFKAGIHFLRYPPWFQTQSNVGFVYVQTLRMDDDRHMRAE